jgi:methyl-accepting chemotaxis protein
LKFISNLKISTKLISGFLVVILLAGVVGIVSIISISSLNAALDDVNTANEISKQSLEARREEKTYIITGNEEYVNEVDSTVTTLTATMKEMEGDPANDKILDTMYIAVSDYSGAFDEYVNAVQDNKVVLTKWTEIGAGFNNEVAAIKTIAKKGDEVYLQADKLETTFVLMRVAAIYFIRTPNETKWVEFQNAMKNTRAETSALMTLTTDSPDLKVSAQSIADYIDLYIAQAEIYHGNEVIKANSDLALAKAGDIIIGSDDVSNALYGGASLLRANARENADSTESSAITMAIAFIVAAVIAGLAVAIVLSRSLSNGINKIVKALTKIATGDLTEKVNITSKDEIGSMATAYNDMQKYLQEMANTAGLIADGNLTVDTHIKSENDTLGKAFAKMTDNLRKLIGSVRSVAENIATASDQLSRAADQAGQATQQIASTSQQVAKGASEQSTSLQQTSTGIDQLSKAILQISQGAQEQAKGVERNVEIVNQVSSAVTQVTNNAQIAAEGSQKAGEAASKGANMARQTVEGMQKIKDAMGIASSGVTALGERSNEIGKIVATIDDIAAQTNLLALNAAIEAARAGEQGRGFAVVADEVRKLAERSSTATKEIADLIANIQNGVNEAVRAMEEGNKEVNSGFELATNAGDSLNEILETVMEVSKEVDRIASASDELNKLSQEMVKVTDGVSSIVEENTAATEQMSASSDQVTKSIETVAGVAEENSAATEEVSASAEEMSAQVQEVVASAQSLAQMAEDLKGNIALFKITSNSGGKASE